MNLLNKFIATVLPFFPRFLVRPFAKPYVAGESLTEAIEKVKILNQQGYVVTMDILGEHVSDKTEAVAVKDSYLELLQTIKLAEITGTVSFKLTHLGLELDQELALKNTMEIVRTARDLAIPVTIDMENSPYTDITIEIYQQARAEFNKVGLVLQAYLFRSVDDIKVLDSTDFRVRICKGIYRESPEIAIQDRIEINDSFTSMTHSLLKGEGFAEIATHDRELLDDLESWIEQNSIPKDRFEFQVLHGVPMGKRLERLLEKGYAVRIYVPFGNAWFDYSVRRLKENPNMAGYIISNLFKRWVSN